MPQCLVLKEAVRGVRNGQLLLLLPVPA
eukprot:COSAG02_NODE_56492_length_285_cov_0.833333_1_plen_27_part_10